MRVYIFLASLLVSTMCMGQIKNPVKWDFTAKKINATTYEVHLTAKLEPGWHTYSQTTPAGGPKPTIIKFTNNPLLIIKGEAKEVGKMERKHDEIFEVDVKQFSDNVDYVQVVKLKAEVKTTITGTVEYMVCNDKECLPPTTKSFSITVP